MKSLWAGAALIGLVATSAAAETQYDRSIEQAAIDIEGNVARTPPIDSNECTAKR